MRGRRPRWYCHACRARGTAATPDQARDAGLAHYVETHDVPLVDLRDVPRVGGDVP